MTEGNDAFDKATDDCSNVPERFLEPLRLNLELPDFARLDKPKPPPVPQVNGKERKWSRTVFRCAGGLRMRIRDHFTKLWEGAVVTSGIFRDLKKGQKKGRKRNCPPICVGIGIQSYSVV